MDTRLRVWTAVADYLTAYERVTLAQSNSDICSVLKSTLTSQFDALWKYRKWKRSLMASEKSQQMRRNAVLVEDKNWYPELVFALDYEPVESVEPGKSLFRNQCGDLLVVPSSVVDDTEEEEIASDYTHLAEGRFAPIDFSNPNDLLKRQKAMLSRVAEKQEMDLQARKQQFLRCYRGQCIWGIILCHGGYFAIGIFDRSSKCLFHESDHRYVSRKKQGGRQMAKDKHSGSNIHSAGSSVRREMEKKHQEAIEAILTAHKAELSRCDAIFLHAPGVNRGFFVAEGAPLRDLKDRIRSVGMTAGRANYTEVQRIQQELATVELRLASLSL